MDPRRAGRVAVSALALAVLTIAADHPGGGASSPRASVLHVRAAASADAPASVPITKEELGRLLFWDPLLSGPKDVSCASCHHPDFGYADGRDLARGTGSVGLGPLRIDASGGAIPVVRRNSPTIVNVAFNGLGLRGGGNNGRRFDGTVNSVDQTRSPMFWDSRVRSLESQALEPLKAFEEMRGATYPAEVALDSVVARIKGVPEYAALFQEVYGDGDPINAIRIGEAIAAFERTLLALNSPFDRSRVGVPNALNDQERRGQQTFNRVGCGGCHQGIMFSDFQMHAEGVKEHQLVAVPDSGASRFRFRTPSLRNVALTAPYMHNGTLATLEDVLRFYDEGRSQNPNVVEPNVANRGDGRGRGRAGQPVAAAPAQGAGVVAQVLQRGPRVTLDPRFRAVRDMSDDEMADIIAFLKALTDDSFDKTIPARVPSGLTPGGAIARR
jgi:cytochrome c peroxidase